MLLPIIALHGLGAEQAGYYFIAFQIANLVNAVSYAVAQAAFSEASQETKNVMPLIKKSARIMFGVLVPVILVSIILGDWILRIIGSEYAANAASVLRLLLLGCIAVAANSMSAYVLKLANRMSRWIVANAIGCVVILGFAQVFVSKGLEWVAFAWILGNAAAAIVLGPVRVPEKPRIRLGMTVNSPEDMGGVRTVLMVAPFVPPHLGGVENYVYNLAVEMVRSRGIRVVVAAPAALGVDRSATEELFSRTTGLELRWLSAPVKVSNTPLGRNWTRVLRRIVEDERVDLVNAHSPVPFLADFAARACADVPFVLTYHSGPMRKGCWWLDAGLLAYERGVLAHTIRRADGLICASSYVLNTLHTSAAPGAGHRPPGSGPADVLARWISRLAGLCVVRRLADGSHRLQGPRDAHRRHDNPAGPGGVPVRLEVVGDGNARRGFEDLVRYKGIESFVRFSASAALLELAEAYRRNAVLAIPSTFDNFPTVALEAMACGLPVVASEVGALPDLVEDGKRGYLVEPGNAGQLADRLADVISDPAHGHRMGAQGRQFVLDNATVASQADRTLDMFARAAERRKAGVRNVAVVAPYYPPQVGGVENYVHRVTRALQESGSHHPVVLSASESRKRTVEIHDGVTVIRLPTLFKLSNTPLHPLWPIMLRREFRRLDVDVVYTHSPVPGLADMAAFVAGDRRVVLTYHSGSLLKGGGLIDRVLAAYEKHFLPIVFRRCSALGAVSPVASSYHTGRAALLPPGVDITTFTPGVDHRSERPTVLFVGRIDGPWFALEGHRGPPGGDRPAPDETARDPAEPGRIEGTPWNICAVTAPSSASPMRSAGRARSAAHHWWTNTRGAARCGGSAVAERSASLRPGSHRGDGLWPAGGGQ